jgi:serralysin
MQLEQTNSSLLEIVELGQRTSFALLRGFADRMRTAFGSSMGVEDASVFIDDIVSGRDSLRLSIVENNELNGAHGAFDQSSGTIFLSKDFVLANSADPSKISAVLLEKFGHLLDAEFNLTGALGDEAIIFSWLVTGAPYTAATLASLRSENDQGVAIIDGKAVALEFAATNSAVTLDRSLADWSPANRLDTVANGVAGYEVFGQCTGNGFVFALRAPAGVTIGTSTTFWLNTDQNTSTGYQIFGFAGGAEYNVSIGIDGKLALYTDAAGQTLVSSAIDYTLSADAARPGVRGPVGAAHRRSARPEHRHRRQRLGLPVAGLCQRCLQGRFNMRTSRLRTSRSSGNARAGVGILAANS